MVETEPAHRSRSAVLVVEDEEIIATYVSVVLRRCGYAVIIARDGEEATDLFYEHASNLVLMLVDIALPRKSGADFLSILPTLEPRIPVIVMSGLGEADIKKKVPKNIYILRKPFTSGGLELAVTRVALPKVSNARS